MKFLAFLLRCLIVLNIQFPFSNIGKRQKILNIIYKSRTIISKWLRNVDLSSYTKNLSITFNVTEMRIYTQVNNGWKLFF